MVKYVAYFLTIFLFACHQPVPSTQKESLKDSVVKQLLSKIDSFEVDDRLDESYRTLKAYINDDTVFLQHLRKRLDDEEKYSKTGLRIDSCVTLAKLSELDVDETYRFWHDQSFCSYGQRITVTKKNDLIRLHYLEYSADPEGKMVILETKGKRDTIQPGCVIKKEFEKKLSLEEWHQLKAFIDVADYWELKPYRQQFTTDGSFWRMEAYRQNPNGPDRRTNHFVERRSPTNLAFRELGSFFLKIAGEKTMCDDFF